MIIYYKGLSGISCWMLLIISISLTGCYGPLIYKHSGEQVQLVSRQSVQVITSAPIGIFFHPSIPNTQNLLLKGTPEKINNALSYGEFGYDFEIYMQKRIRELFPNAIRLNNESQFSEAGSKLELIIAIPPVKVFFHAGSGFSHANSLQYSIDIYSKDLVKIGSFFGYGYEHVDMSNLSMTENTLNTIRAVKKLAISAVNDLIQNVNYKILYEKSYKSPLATSIDVRRKKSKQIAETYQKAVFKTNFDIEYTGLEWAGNVEKNVGVIMGLQSVIGINNTTSFSKFLNLPEFNQNTVYANTSENCFLKQKQCGQACTNDTCVAQCYQDALKCYNQTSSNTSNSTDNYSGDTGNSNCNPVPKYCKKASNKGIELINKLPNTTGLSDSASTGYCGALIGIRVNRFCADEYRDEGRDKCAQIVDQQVIAYQKALPQYQSVIDAASMSRIRSACHWEK